MCRGDSDYRECLRIDSILALREAVEELVIEHAHPGNLGVLPPSPMRVYQMARYLDLITYREFVQCSEPLSDTKWI